MSGNAKNVTEESKNCTENNSVKDKITKDLILAKNAENKLDKLTAFIKGRMNAVHDNVSAFQHAYDNMVERAKIEAYGDVLEEVERMKDLPVAPDNDDENFIKASKNILTDKILNIFMTNRERPSERRLKEIRAGKVANIIEGLFMQFYMLGVNAGARGVSTVDPYTIEKNVEDLKSFKTDCTKYRDMSNDPMFFLFLADMAGANKKDIADAREALKQERMPSDIANIVGENYFDML